VTWNEDAAWKLALEGPTRVRQLLLGHVDFDSTTTTAASSTANTTTTTNNITTNSAGIEATNAGGTRCIIDFDRSSGSNTNDEDGLSLCLEASHSAPRIIHQADRTGRAITEGITATAAHHPLINFMSDSIVVDLLYDDIDNNETDNATIVIGARILDTKTNTITNQYAVHGVVLASGGLCGIYEQTTNPNGFNALGSSVALALRLEENILGNSIGASSGTIGGGGEGTGIVSDLEYVQFHPTALCIPNESRFLLTEALRGEGAILRDATGRAFAKDYHTNGELAPRDVVARAVYAEMSRKRTTDRWLSNWETVHHSDFVGRANDNWYNCTTGATVHNAYLDITHRDAEWLVNRFPGVHAYLMSRSVPLDFTKDMIPVTPAAHYTCGGVITDLDGRVTTTANKNNSRREYCNLYAAGEAARTGLHGGNRLASTSLLEGLVFGSSVGDIVAADDDCAALMADRARQAIARRLVTTVGPYCTTTTSSTMTISANDAITREATAILTRLKSVMWNDVGVVRTPAGLEHAVSELTAMCSEAERLWDTGEGGREAAALRDASRSGLAVADAALRNRISGGCHYLAPMVEIEQRYDDDDDDEEDGQAMARA
jgi:L-aspartate oxidase